MYRALDAGPPVDSTTPVSKPHFLMSKTHWMCSGSVLSRLISSSCFYRTSCSSNTSCTPSLVSTNQKTHPPESCGSCGHDRRLTAPGDGVAAMWNTRCTRRSVSVSRVNARLSSATQADRCLTRRLVHTLIWWFPGTPPQPYLSDWHAI